MRDEVKTRDFRLSLTSSLIPFFIPHPFYPSGVSVAKAERGAALPRQMK
jgi:hypothetical protein